MKKILLFLLTTIISFSSFAQNLPQGIAYQAVAVKEGPFSVAGENPQAIYWSNKDIKVRFTILDQYPNPMETYQEFHSVKTDDYGVFNLIVGQGTVISGDFETIPWELGAAHLQVEIDFENEDDYTVTSFERFWSVPYAFATKKVKGTNIDSAIQALNDKIIYLKDRDQDTVIGNEGITYKTIDSLNQVLQSKIDVLRANDLDTVVGNEIQTLAIKGDSLSISDGNTVKIDFPTNLDNDPINEIQSLTLNGDSLSISNGNTVKIGFPVNLDNDSTNEIQILAIKGDSLSISDGNTVKIDFPTNLDNDPINEIQSLTLNGDSLSISNGNTVKIDFPANLDNDSTNEIQILAIKGDSLSISDGNTVKIDFPANLDNDSTNEIQTISLTNDTISLSDGGGDIALESIKAYVQSSLNSSGKNGTIDDMWFGVLPNQGAEEPLLYLDADTVYVLGITNRSTPYVIKLYPNGSRDTLIRLANAASNTNNMRVSLPYLYHTVFGSPIQTKIYHIDTGFVRMAKTTFALNNHATDNITTDDHHNLIYLERGGNSYKAGTVYFYNFKKDTTFTLTNPDNDYRGLTPPQLINDSMVLIVPRIWKTSSDNLVPTSQVIDFYWNSSINQLFVPIVINDHKILYEKQIYESYGTSAGWHTVLKLYNLKTKSSVIVEGKGGRGLDTRNGGTYRMYNFKGISDNKLLISVDFDASSNVLSKNFFWFDTDNHFLKRFMPDDGQITLNTENRCYYKRISLRSGTWKVNNFTRLSFPNVNYTRPTGGITYLHE